MGKDRKDAKRVKLPGLMQCCIDLKPTRMENEVYINKKLDVTELAKYIERKKEEGIKYTFFQAFVAAVAKTIFARPKLNRFIKNRHLYEHNKVELAFVAKMELNDKSEEIMLSLQIDPTDTIDTLADKVTARVSNLRGGDVDKKGANDAIDKLCGLPNALRVPIFGIIKFADNKGLLPADLMKDNIYFSSMIISNLGSIKCGAIYHNLANFGTCSGLASMGEVIDEKIIMPDGTEEVRKICEFGITLDERIADGFYFAKSISIVDNILQHPEMLEEPLGNVESLK